METREEILRSLPQFSGTQEWHKWSILFPRFVLTDGAKYVADACGAYWLMDLIASWQTRAKVRQEDFQVWTLKVKDREGRVVADDGDGNKLAEQIISNTDFPLDEIKLYFINDGDYWVMLLPGEY